MLAARSSPRAKSQILPAWSRLVVGARHQRHSGDASREPQIVLDARRGAGLSAECAAVQHEDREPFGSGIDRSSEACWPGAHHGHVVDALRINRPDHSQRRASSLSLGLRNNYPSGHSTIGNWPEST